MNKTKIEWCDRTWNPVTGCLHGCEYCYASKIAHRFDASEKTLGKYGSDKFRWTKYSQDDNPMVSIYDVKSPMTYYAKHGGKGTAAYPFGFLPTFHGYRLEEPMKVKSPQNIFVCSMADLFGDWVPDEWIKRVFHACELAPWHRYLFLTKNGSRYEQLDLLPDKENFWYGTTRTGVNNELEVGASDHRNTFLSIEPILAPIDKSTLRAIGLWKWVIIGAETGNRKERIVPERAWIQEIVDACTETGARVFMKDSLSPMWGNELIREFPWE